MLNINMVFFMQLNKCIKLFLKEFLTSDSTMNFTDFLQIVF